MVQTTQQNLAFISSNVQSIRSLSSSRPSPIQQATQQATQQPTSHAAPFPVQKHAQRSTPLFFRDDIRQPAETSAHSLIDITWPDAPQSLRTPAQTTPPHSRPLSGNEQFYYDSAQHRDGWGTSAICLRVKADAPTAEHISAALACLQQSHIGLQVSIKPPQFAWQAPTWQHQANIPAIPFELNESEDDNAWQKTLNELTQTKINTTENALVQFKLLHNRATQTCDILLGFHHALVDGAGAWHLMQTFTQLCWTKAHLTQPKCKPDPDAIERFFNHQNKTLPYEQACSRNAIRKVGLSTVGDAFKNSLPKLNPALSAPDHANNSVIKHPTPLHFSRITLKPETVKALLKTAKAHDTNLNGAITALALHNSQELFKTYWPGFTPIQYLTPISLRSRIPNWEIEDLGVCVTTTNHLKVLWPNHAENFWAQARACKTDLHDAINAGTPEATFHLLENLNTPLRKDKLIFAHMPKNFILVNNLGKLELPPTHDEDYDYQALSWATHQEPCAALAQFYFATLGNTLSLTVQSSRLTQAQVDQLANNMNSQLLSLI